ncbi:hypothetical protein [Ferruginibacter sp.]
MKKLTLLLLFAVMHFAVSAQTKPPAVTKARKTKPVKTDNPSLKQEIIWPGRGDTAKGKGLQLKRPPVQTGVKL